MNEWFYDSEEQVLSNREPVQLKKEHEPG
jgi:hypothetical protein